MNSLFNYFIIFTLNRILLKFDFLIIDFFIYYCKKINKYFNLISKEININ